MTTRRSHQAFALVLSVFITIAIFSGVSSLAAPEHGGALLAQASAPAQS